MEKGLKVSGVIILLLLALVGWYVLLAQKPDILARARVRYNQAVTQKIDLSSGPCLGIIADGWVLDIAHLPRQPIDDLPQNQCQHFSHFVEMSPQGEVIHVE
ncbi:hypothetical protein HY440_01605 [Candidatus Microgenomates bacterium]|nr:hypothetical protein [Candidatus Microgenomates bacterium]